MGPSHFLLLLLLVCELFVVSCGAFSLLTPAPIPSSVGHAEALRQYQVASRAIETARLSKLLKKKKQRLRLLREDIDHLTKEVKGADSLAASGDVNDKKDRRRKQKVKEHKWRARMMEQLKRISERLRRLELGMNGENASLPVSTPSSSISPLPSPPPSPTPSGLHGGTCSAHGNCRPGHCCVRSTLDGPTTCSRLDKEESDVCSDSCECARGLSCFQQRNVNSTAFASCKIPESSDIVTGSYLNSATSVILRPTSSTAEGLL